MKTYLQSILLICTLALSGQALASESSTAREDFVKSFIAETNAHLKTLNAERAAVGKKAYCKKLNDQQIKLIKNSAKNPEVTVVEFVNAVSDKLQCYEPFWAPWERKNMRGTLFNTKAFVLDYQLIREVLQNVNEGRAPHDEELLY